jgi:AhpC/TSA family
VSEDRFDDLRAGAGEQPSPGDRLAERDRTHPEPAGPPERPRSRNKYAWAVGILFVMVLSVLLFAQTIPNSGEGLFGPERGSRLKAFATPSALGNLEGDANVCQSEPCPEGAGDVPACELRSDDVINLCELRDRPLVLTFIFDRGADCYPQVDRTERVMSELDGVRFATVYFSRKKRDEIRRLVEARGWTQPVGVDEDGGVVNLYGIGGCPTTIFARPGGRVADVELGNLTEAELRAKARRISG